MRSWSTRRWRKGSPRFSARCPQRHTNNPTVSHGRLPARRAPPRPCKSQCFRCCWRDRRARAAIRGQGARKDRRGSRCSSSRPNPERMHLMAGKRNFLSVSGAVEYVKEVFLFNVDDLGRIREATPARCRQHIAPAEQVIDRLTCDLEQKREEALKRVFARLNGKLTETDKED